MTAFYRMHLPAVLISGFSAGIWDSLRNLFIPLRSSSSHSQYFIPFCPFPANFSGITPLFVLSWQSHFSHSSLAVLLLFFSVQVICSVKLLQYLVWKQQNIFSIWTNEEQMLHSFLVKLFALLWNEKALSIFAYFKSASTNTMFFNLLYKCP